VKAQSIHFKSRAAAALDNPVLQDNLRRFSTGGLAQLRAAAVQAYGPGAFEELRDAARDIRNRVLGNLDAWIERFEREAAARGATVLFAETAEEARDLVLAIARRHGLSKAVKSKSMLSEEAGLNEALAAAGVQPVETDLGEYIIQLAGEAPSHIIAPAVHKSRDQVSDLFQRHHGGARKTVIPELTREAREALRKHFLSADLGISGGNFLVAETGSGAIVTNEGNGRMVTTLPRVHVCITGIEKVVPTLEDFSTLLRVLTRSATGQAISNYVSFFTGPAAADVQGPRHMYFILVDAGRSSLAGTDMQDMLRCIRCGACQNHCPVYHSVGGHAYGWVYAGPMGAVLTPSFIGLENAPDLPQAATLCGACSVVCPVKIPLPDLLRNLREKEMDRGLRPRHEVLGIRVWSWFAQRPKLYALATKMGMRLLRAMADRNGMLSWLPFGGGWTQARNGGRYMPAPAGKTFREQYAAKRR
jgi:L-lactate dehydrogenase complex protein LldF